MPANKKTATKPSYDGKKLSFMIDAAAQFNTSNGRSQFAPSFSLGFIERDPFEFSDFLRTLTKEGNLCIFPSKANLTMTRFNLFARLHVGNETFNIITRRSILKQRNPFQKLVVVALSFFLVFSFAACGGGGKAVKSEEPAGAVQSAARETALEKRYDAVVFQKFDIDPKIEADYPGVVVDCEDSAIAALRLKNLFQKVEKEGAGARYDAQTLLVKPRVVNMRIVSGGARFWVGPLAGTSDMVVELKMSDAVTGKIVHEKVLSTANNPFAAVWVWGSSDRSLPADMGKIIAEYIGSIMPAR